MLLLRVMVPVPTLSDKPLGVAENVPPAWPVTVGVGLVPVWQNVLPE